MKRLQTIAQSAAAALDDAHCLPFDAYTSPALLEQEIERIFHRDWVFACAEASVAKAGDYYAFDLAGEPVAVIRGQDGSLRAMSNACRHRGTLLLDEGSGACPPPIVCPYHGWAYSDRGQLLAAPMTGDQNVDRQAHCLAQFECESWLGLVFVRLNGQGTSLHERCAALQTYLSPFEVERFAHQHSTPPQHWQANWKLAMENAMESYHLFKVHKTTLETVTPTREAYYVAGCSEWSLTGGAINEQRGTLQRWLQGDIDPVYQQYLLILLPPSFVGILTYDSLDWISVIPAGVDSCRIHGGGISASTQSLSGAEQSFVEAFFAEDKWICERVQKAMGARLAHGGKLVEMERIVVDFHQYLANRLFGAQRSTLFQTDQARLFQTMAHKPRGSN